MAAGLRETWKSKGAAVKVSVIVPFHNAQATLARALESIAASSHDNFEALMIDDCSSDPGSAIAVDFALRDERFRYFRNAENRKVSFSRNRGLDMAAGDFLMFVDADDWISPDWIANLLDDAVASESEIVIGKAMRFRGGQERDYRMAGLERRGPLWFEAVVFKDNSVVWNKLYSAAMLRREKLRFDEDLYIGEDLLFNFKAMSRARGIFYSGRGHYHYHADNEDSIMRSSTPAERISNLSLVLRRLVDYSNALERKNKAAPRKVARDILVNHCRYMDGPLDASTMGMIRALDRFLLHKVRFSLFRKAVRKAFVPGPRKNDNV